MILSPQSQFIGAALAIIVVGVVMFAAAEEVPRTASDSGRVIAIVTHVENPQSSITRSELARIFLKQQTTWPNGERCIPIDQRGDSAIRKDFSRLVLQRTVHEMKRYWMQETMTGNAKPPISLESAATVKKYVQKIDGAVAYIYLDEVDESVRILGVEDVPPLAPPLPEVQEEPKPGAAAPPSESTGTAPQDGSP